MVEFTFTGAGSLIHPLLMITLIPLYILTWILGIMARQARLAPPQGEETPMLQRDLRSVARGKRWHHKLSAFLLFFTYFVMLVGMYNTFLRAGRLFPGPHMYGGFWFVLLTTLQASLVPWFADHKIARNVHTVVGLAVMICLFSQFWTGIPILKSVWKLVFS